MKPLNRAERSNAFLNFLLLFTITIGIVVAVVFFSMKTSFHENEQLRNQVLMMQHEQDLSDSFRVAMNVVLNELSNYDTKKNNPVEVIQGNVQKKIERMIRLTRNMPDEMSDEDKSFYDLVIQNLADLNKAKLRIRNLEDQKQ